MQKVALIPARIGSKRIPRKNLAVINGHPLIAYSINSALNTHLFDRVIVSTDSAEVAEISLKYGAEVPSLRPEEYSTDQSPDISWISYALDNWVNLDDEDLIVILRPTNPLRSSNTITSALEYFLNNAEADSLRAMRQVKEHPHKMWKNKNNLYVEPINPHINKISGVEAHSTPTQLLGEVFVQDASLEIIRVWVLKKLGSLTGNKTLKFEMPDFEGFDINYPTDIAYLQYLLEKKLVQLPIL